MSANHVTADISALFDGIPAKILARWTGRPAETIRDCRAGRSRWRADDIIAASAHSAEVRARALRLLTALEHRCQPSP